MPERCKMFVYLIFRSFYPILHLYTPPPIFSYVTTDKSFCHLRQFFLIPSKSISIDSYHKISYFPRILQCVIINPCRITQISHFLSIV